MLAGKLDDVLREEGFIGTALRDAALGGAVLSERAGQARRSLTPSVCRTRSMQHRRREGLSNFPQPPP